MEKTSLPEGVKDTENQYLAANFEMNGVIEPDYGSDKNALSEQEKESKVLNQKIAKNVNQKSSSIKEGINSIDIYDQRISMREMKNIK